MGVINTVPVVLQSQLVIKTRLAMQRCESDKKTSPQKVLSRNFHLGTYTHCSLCITVCTCSQALDTDERKDSMFSGLKVVYRSQNFRGMRYTIQCSVKIPGCVKQVVVLGKTSGSQTWCMQYNMVQVLLYTYPGPWTVLNGLVK